MRIWTDRSPAESWPLLIHVSGVRLRFPGRESGSKCNRACVACSASTTTTTTATGAFTCAGASGNGHVIRQLPNVSVELALADCLDDCADLHLLVRIEAVCLCDVEVQ